jgi:RHS repeat-associated protein
MAGGDEMHALGMCRGKFGEFFLGHRLSEDSPPTVTLTSPLANATMAAPGSFTLAASATAPGSSVSKVEFFADGILINTDTTAPYTYLWNNVLPGTHSLLALATNALGKTALSPTINVTVTAAAQQAYYLHTDHLDTPRIITDTQGNTVWQWDNSDPFGDNPPNENPSGLGIFKFDLRFPGQVFDKETGTHYNVNRDYDPAIGRYVQSDPIGLQGGINTYTYVGNNPISFVDPDGRNPVVAGGIILAGLAAWKGIEFVSDMGQMLIRAEMAADAQRAADAMSAICKSSRNSGACNAAENFQQQAYQCTADTAKLGAAAAWNANKSYPSSPIMPGWKPIP